MTNERKQNRREFIRTNLGRALAIGAAASLSTDALGIGHVNTTVHYNTCHENWGIHHNSTHTNWWIPSHTNETSHWDADFGHNNTAYHQNYDF